MIASDNRALSEWFRNRCKRTGIRMILPISKQIQFSAKALLCYPFAVLLLRALIHEFARVSRVIICEAIYKKNSP
jgi:hypothetical protein